MPIDIYNDDIDTAMSKLKARENIFRQLETVSKLGSWEIDFKSQKATWSKRSYEIYGIKENTPVTLDTFMSMVLPEDVQKIQDAILRLIEKEDSSSITCKIRREDGEILTLLINGSVIFDADDRPSKLIGTTQDISEYAALTQHATALSHLLEHSSNEIYILSLETQHYLYVNQGACDALGYSRDELLSMHETDINPFLDAKKIVDLHKRLKTSNKALNRSIHKKKDGSTYPVQSYLHDLEYQGNPAYVVFSTDISQIVSLEQAQKKQATILDYIHDSVISTDLKGNITSWNKGSTLLFEYEAYEMLGKNILTTYDMQNPYTPQELFSTLHKKESLNIEAYMLTKSKQRIICDISLSVSKDVYNEIDGYIGYIQDITMQKATQKLLQERTKQLEYQANYDSLTNLPNRALFQDRMLQTIASSKRNKSKFALLFIDLDQFKKINDTLGHHIGDDVLVLAAQRLRTSIREEDTLARIGGDEFTIILPDIQDDASPSIVAQKIIDIMNEALQIKQHNLYIGASIGISIYPDDSSNKDDLIKYADSAMYKAKENGRSQFKLYSSDMTSFAFEKVVMENSLRVAIQEKQFIIYFQPQINAQTDTMIGMEALLRWNHPSLGLISPGRFLSVAEETGLIVSIDKIVMKQAMEQFSLWYKQGFNPGVLSLNLGMKQLNEEIFLDNLKNIMKKLDFSPNWLELEVTEGQVMHNPTNSINKLQKISALGINIAIDDFGTGYSSLSYLKKLPLDKLKIDKSFIDDIPGNEDDVAITQAIIALGKSLKLTLIAEGVETLKQKTFLLENGCDLIQGYLYSKPLSAIELQEKFLTIET